MYFGLVTGILCYSISWLGMLIAIVLIHRLVAAEKRKERKELRGQQQLTHRLWADPQVFMMNYNPHLFNELRNVMLVSTLLVIYFVFIAPYLIRVKVDQIVQVT